MMKRLLSFFAAGIMTLSLFAMKGVSIDGVDVDEGSGNGWSYANKSLTISEMRTEPYVLNGSNVVGEVQIKVTADSTIVLSNLVIKANTSNQCALQINPGVIAEVRLWGENKLTSGPRCAGIQVGAGGLVRLKQHSLSSPGFLTAQGGSQGGPGIGGKSKTNAGNVHIEGGVIKAMGGSEGAGIGGGLQRTGGEIVISGGTVYAEALDDADDIGNGASAAGAASVMITGGSVNTANGIINNAPTNALGEAVYCVTVTGLVANAAVDLKNLDGYGCNGIYADDAGQAYLWLTNGVYDFQANGVGYHAAFTNEPVVAEVRESNQPVGVCVNGEDIGFYGSGNGWLFDAASRKLVFTGTVPVSFSTLHSALCTENAGTVPVSFSTLHSALCTENAGTVPFDVSGTNVLDSLTVMCEVRTSLKFFGFKSEGLCIEGMAEIAGGTVAVAESRGALTITGGSVNCNDFAMPPSNGVTRVWRVTVCDLPSHSSVEVTGIEGYGVDGLVADADGCICLWLPNGDYIFSVNGGLMRAIVDDADSTAADLPEVTLTGVSVNGVDAAYGCGHGWSYEASQLSLTDARSFMLSGTNENGAVAVSVQADAKVTISNLVLVTSAGSPMSIQTNCAAELVLTGENMFRSDDRAFPALQVPSGAELVIRADSLFGSLTATGGRWGAGIGGGDSEDAGRIEIQSGTIEAVMGERSDFDIGGGPDGAGADVVISGGSVKAGAIDKHPVNERGQSLSCVTVTNLVPGAAVALTGLTGYGTGGLVADADGKLYLWLPDGTHSFAAGGRRHEVTVAGGAVTATDAGPAAAVTVPTQFSIGAIRVKDDVAELDIVTDLDSGDFAAWADGVVFRVDFRTTPGGDVTETLLPQRTGATLVFGRPVAPSAFFTVRASDREP